MLTDREFGDVIFEGIKRTVAQGFRCRNPITDRCMYTAEIDGVKAHCAWGWCMTEEEREEVGDLTGSTYDIWISRPWLAEKYLGTRVITYTTENVRAQVVLALQSAHDEAADGDFVTTFLYNVLSDTLLLEVLTRDQIAELTAIYSAAGDV